MKEKMLRRCLTYVFSNSRKDDHQVSSITTKVRGDKLEISRVRIGDVSFRVGGCRRI